MLLDGISPLDTQSQTVYTPITATRQAQYNSTPNDKPNISVTRRVRINV